MAVDKDTRTGYLRVGSLGSILFVAISDCYNVVRMVAVVGGKFAWRIGMSKVWNSSAVVVHETSLHSQPDAGWLMVGMRRVCKVGERRWNYC